MKDYEKIVPPEFRKIVSTNGMEVSTFNRLWGMLLKLSEEFGKRGDHDQSRLLSEQSRVMKETASDLEKAADKHKRRPPRPPKQMTAYEVVASNKWFFQRLVVVASSNVDAAYRFRAYLKSPERLTQEEYELSQASCLDYEDENPEALMRDNYRYNLYTVEVGEFAGDPKWTGTPSKEVQVIDAGSKG